MFILWSKNIYNFIFYVLFFNYNFPILRTVCVYVHNINPHRNFDIESYSKLNKKIIKPITFFLNSSLFTSSFFELQDSVFLTSWDWEHKQFSFYIFNAVKTSLGSDIVNVLICFQVRRKKKNSDGSNCICQCSNRISGNNKTCNWKTTSTKLRILNIPVQYLKSIRQI